MDREPDAPPVYRAGSGYGSVRSLGVLAEPDAAVYGERLHNNVGSRVSTSYHNGFMTAQSDCCSRIDLSFFFLLLFLPNVENVSD